jgi:hypothetical protein
MISRPYAVGEGRLRYSYRLSLPASLDWDSRHKRQEGSHRYTQGNQDLKFRYSSDLVLMAVHMLGGRWLTGSIERTSRLSDQKIPSGSDTSTLLSDLFLRNVLLILACFRPSKL